MSMNHDNSTLHDMIEQIRTAFDAHEKEHKDLMNRSIWVLIGSLAMIASIGIWVGTINSDVQYAKQALTEKVSRDEFIGAVSTINTKFENITEKQNEMNATLKSILSIVSSLRQ